MGLILSNFQVVYLGLLGFIVFTFLIIVMYGYKRMNNGIQVALFVHPPKSTSRLHAFTRIIGGTILAAVFLILTSGILWIFYFFVENTFHINAAELFVNITQLEIGWIIITYGIFILLFTLIALLLTFFFKNGYSFILRRVSLTEEKLDQKMERAGEKVGQKFHDLKKVPESKESKTPATKPPASPEKKTK